MLRKITLAGVVTASMLVAGVAHAAPDKPDENGTRAFLVDLDVTKPGDAIDAILAAGHEQFAAACEAAPSATIRILNPLAANDYRDVACSDILGVETVGNTSAALSSEPGMENVGEAREKLTPVGPILCGLLGALETGAFSKACGDWRGSSSQVCTVGGAYNTVFWIAACALMF